MKWLYNYPTIKKGLTILFWVSVSILAVTSIFYLIPFVVAAVIVYVLYLIVSKFFSFVNFLFLNILYRKSIKKMLLN